MNPLLWHVVGLRYRLLWAQARTRNGKIAIFLLLYITGVLVAVALGMGGFGAALTAVRLGKALPLAQGLFTALFLNAVIGSVLLGIGIRAAFTDEVLRRYPLSSAGRLAARHLAGIADPMWLLMAACALGLALGYYVFADAVALAGLAAALLFVLCTFSAAKALMAVIEWALKYRSGPVILGVLLSLAAMGPAVFMPLLRRSHHDWRPLASVFSYAPPFAAAALLTAHAWLPALLQIALLTGWCVLLFYAALALDRVAPPARHAESAAIEWDSRFDRMGAWFGPVDGPVVAKSLRYHTRRPRVRFQMALIIPVLGLIAYAFGHQPKMQPVQVAGHALAAVFILGFSGEASNMLNVFGCEGLGFRRYLMLPIPLRAVLRANSYATLLISLALVPVCVVVWVLVGHLPGGSRLPLMLAGSSLTGVFFFAALGLWTSLLAPRRLTFSNTFGNELSAAANVVLIGGVFGCIAAAALLERRLTLPALLGHWWVAPLAAGGAMLFYAASLRAGSAWLEAHANRILDTLEGRI